MATPPPDWMLRDIDELSSLDTALAEVDPKIPTETPPPLSPVDGLYWELSGFFNAPLDVVFVAPFINRGGADLLTLHHLAACVEKGMNCLLVTTLDEESSWLQSVPKEVRVRELGRRCQELTSDESSRLLLRLLLQSPAVLIHNIQSAMCWQVFSTNGEALKAAGKRLFCSLYHDDIDARGMPIGYMGKVMDDCLESLEGILTDSKTLRGKLLYRTGYPPDKLHAVYSPAFIKAEQYAGDSTARRLLWVSRIARNKVPEIVVELARRLPDYEIDMYGSFDPQFSADICADLEGQKNINLKGAYSSFEEVAALASYTAYLFTSSADGLPFVLREAVSSGLPIIASDVGGVAELLDQDGFGLVRDWADVDEYERLILRLTSDPEPGRSQWKKLKAKLTHQFSWKSFTESLNSIPIYYPSKF